MSPEYPVGDVSVPELLACTHTLSQQLIFQPAGPLIDPKRHILVTRPQIVSRSNKKANQNEGKKEV